MATEIVRWCDPCMAAGQRVPSQPVPLWDDKTIDLCEPHIAEYVEPLARLVAEFGVRTDGKRQYRRKRTDPAVEAPPAPEVVHATTSDGPAPQGCLLCGAYGMTRDELATHLRTEHEQTPVGVYGQTCPICGWSGNGLGPHAFRAHRAIGIRNTWEAFAYAREHGDPLGIVSARLAAVAA